MSKRICFGFTVLPFLTLYGGQGLIANASLPRVNITGSNTVELASRRHNQPQVWQVAARDDQTGDCLRSRSCKD